MKINIKGVIVVNDDKFAYDYYGIEAVCPKDVATLIDQAKGEKIDVNINSPGGDIFAGNEIYEALRQYRGAVSIHVIHAASAASVIAEAGESDITPTGMFMVHNVSGGAYGDYKEVGAVRDLLITANKAISAAYQLKTGKTEKELLTMMDKGAGNLGTWLTAKEAVEQKFIDKISENQNLKLVAAFGSQMLPQQVIEKLKNTVKGPQDDAGFLIQAKAKAQLELLNLKGKQA